MAVCRIQALAGSAQHFFVEIKACNLMAAGRERSHQSTAAACGFKDAELLSLPHFPFSRVVFRPCRLNEIGFRHGVLIEDQIVVERRIVPVRGDVTGLRHRKECQGQSMKQPLPRRGARAAKIVTHPAISALPRYQRRRRKKRANPPKQASSAVDGSGTLSSPPPFLLDV